MRDLFSGCAVVHLGMSISDHVRNVSLRSHSGTEVSLICALYEDVRMMLLGEGRWGEQQCGGRQNRLIG